MSTAAEFDANVERLKACEHIAEGEEGWETLRNLCPSTAAVATLRERVEELEEELDEARLGPWPEWAEKLLRLLESWGAEYEHDDEINLPDELAEWLHHYASDLKRTRTRSADGAANSGTGEQ